MMTEKEVIDSAIRANKDHQYALKVYIERLDSELKTADSMMAAIDSDDDTEDIQENGLVYVEGATKPVSLVPPRFLLSEDSPFYEDARWKRRYEESTSINQMKAKENEALREAVRVENMRMLTLDAQSRNQQFDLKAFPPEHFEQNTEGIDWKRVSVKMSSLVPSSEPRTPRECEIRWLGHLHPSINHSTWTPEETARVRSIIAEEEAERVPINWAEIAKKLGTNRTPIDCMRHGMTRRVHTWSPEADQKLREAVELYGQNNWQLVAMNVSEDATAHQCQKRYLDTLDPSLKNGPWSPEEDEQLRRAITAFSGASAVSSSTSGGVAASEKQMIPWQDVALFVPGRTNNQCREHYQDRILKSKTKGKGKRAKGSLKVRGKTYTTDDLEGTEETAESDATEVVERVETSNARKNNLGSTVNARPKVTGKGKQRTDGVGSTSVTGIDAAAGEPLGSVMAESAPRARPQPRPRPRRKVESAVTQPNVADDSEPRTRPEPPIGTPSGPNSIHNSRPSPTRQDVRRSTAERETRPLSTNVEHSEQVSSDQNVDAAELQASDPEPVTKKRKAVGRPRKGASTSAEVLLHARSQGTQELGPSGEIVPHVAPDEDERPGRRRSARLSKGKI